MKFHREIMKNHKIKNYERRPAAVFRDAPLRRGKGRWATINRRRGSNGDEKRSTWEATAVQAALNASVILHDTTKA